MNAKISKSFDLSYPVELVWAFFNDPEKMVACLPGATLVETLDPLNHKGKVTLKVGPAKLKYNGLVTFENINHESRTLRLIGKGVDIKGKGTANMEMDAMILLKEEITSVEYTMNISVAGMLAQFGARLITEATHSVFDQFGKNVNESLAGMDVDNSLYASDVIKGMFKKRKD